MSNYGATPPAPLSTSTPPSPLALPSAPKAAPLASNLQDIHVQIGQVTQTMHSNLQKASQNLRAVEDLEEASQGLVDTSIVFHSKSRSVLCREKWKNYRLIFLGILIIAVVIVILTCSLGGCK